MAQVLGWHVHEWLNFLLARMENGNQIINQIKMCLVVEAAVLLVGAGLVKCYYQLPKSSTG